MAQHPPADRGGRRAGAASPSLVEAARAALHRGLPATATIGLRLVRMTAVTVGGQEVLGLAAHEVDEVRGSVDLPGDLLLTCPGSRQRDRLDLILAGWWRSLGVVMHREPAVPTQLLGIEDLRSPGHLLGLDVAEATVRHVVRSEQRTCLRLDDEEFRRLLVRGR